MDSVKSSTKYIVIALVAIIFVFLIASCNSPSYVQPVQPGYAAQPQMQQAPIVVQQGDGMGGFWGGMMMGHMLGGGYGSSHTTIVNNSVVHAPAPTAPAQAPAYRPSVNPTYSARSVPTYNRSFGGSRSISVGRRR